VKLVTAREMQEIDRATIEAGLVAGLALMENAGRAVAAQAVRLLDDPRGARVEIVCGKGNNGGDGLVIARVLAGRGARVQVHLTHPPENLTPDARANHSRLGGTGVAVSILPDEIPETGRIDDPRRRAVAPPTSADGNDLARRLRAADLCIDALLGTGVERLLEGRLSALVDLLNHSSRRTLAVDVPSGVDATTGKILGTAVWADVTVTLGLPKLGCVLEPGRERVGRLEIANIGFPESVLGGVTTAWNWVDASVAGGLVPRLVPTAHKYSRGCLLVVAGSRSYPGAAALAASAALRTGAGMVHLVVPASIRDILETQLPEVIIHPAPESANGSCAPAVLEVVKPILPRVDAVAIGPGVGDSAETREWIRRFLRELELPAVVDADAVLALPKPPHRGPRIVTPHAGELARWMDLPKEMAQASRLETSVSAAATHEVVVVAKGAPTVVVEPSGTRWVNSTGNPGLGTAGSGDVLTGMVGSLLAQRLSAPDAATLGVYLHGLAADLAAASGSPRSILAGDIPRFIGQAYSRIDDSRK
jgi:ADP-dependent NAD(P)H-hydrate dehydratase / NAD(P)H-hydrate epimerase